MWEQVGVVVDDAAGVLRWDQLSTPVPASALTADANEDKLSGAMYALVPSPTDLDRLAIDDMEPPDELHLTLWFLGDAADLAAADVEGLRVQAETLASELSPIEVPAFGIGLWNWAGDTPSVVLNVGDPDREMSEIRATLGDRADDVLLNVWADIVESQHYPWVPHVCLAYADDLELIPEVLSRVGMITFDTLRLAVGEQNYDYYLGT